MNGDDDDAMRIGEANKHKGADSGRVANQGDNDDRSSTDSA